MDIQNILVPIMILFFLGIIGIIVLSIRVLLLMVKALKIYISNDENK